MTAVASCGALLIAAEGPFLRFYRAKDSQFVSSVRVFKAQAVHGISVYAEDHNDVIKLVVWGGRLVRALEVNLTASCSGLTVALSNIGKASDWILDLSPRPTSLENESEYQEGTCAAVTAHNALLRVTIERRCADQHSDARYDLQQHNMTLHLRPLTQSLVPFGFLSLNLQQARGPSSTLPISFGNRHVGFSSLLVQLLAKSCIGRGPRNTKMQKSLEFIASFLATRDQYLVSKFLRNYPLGAASN